MRAYILCATHDPSGCKETIQLRTQRGPAFRKGLLQEDIECLLAGDVDAGKAVLRDYVNATFGF
ncbi:MAG: hypothetical protein OEQ18_08010 [Gammaproteobacteria bacterium]|nr:hypothetical protein [Gammaproteobacteria bacterium]